MPADAAEIRVLGSLIEKQRTTPDVYPLSLNALRAACNQSTNRDPVVDYDEATIRGALERLTRRQWVRLASGPGSRAVKYRHLLNDAIGLNDAEISLLTVLMLRGPQTIGELKGRSERMHRFASLTDVVDTLDALARRELATQLPRRPGQKEERWMQTLGGDPTAQVHTGAGAPGDVTAAPAEDGDARVADLEERVARLEDELEAVRQALRSLGGPAH